MKLKISEDESLPIYEDAEGNWFIPLDDEALKDLKKEIQDIIDEEILKSMLEVAKQQGLNIEYNENTNRT